MSTVIALGGAGHIGSWGVRELVKRNPEIDVIIADFNFESAQNLAAELGGKIKAVQVDVNDHDRLVQVMRGADIIINSVGPYYLYGERIVQAAIEAKTHLVDICDDGDAIVKMLDHNNDAKAAGITIVVGLGATPGITNIMGRYGADKLDRVNDIDTAWAWTSVDSGVGPAIIEHCFHAITGEIMTYRDGNWVKIPAQSNPRVMDFVAPVGRFEVAEVGHPEPMTIPLYIKGVKNVTNRGALWPPSIMDFFNMLKKFGLSKTDEVSIRGQVFPARTVCTYLLLGLGSLVPRELSEEILADLLNRYGEFGIKGVALRVEVRGEIKGKPVMVAYGCGAAGDLLTSLPSVLGAKMLLDGHLKTPGVFAPEGIIKADLFLRELGKDITVEETITQLLE